jgi:hypothetical protein
MRKLALISISLLLLSCKDNSGTVTISKDRYKILTGDTLKPKYPKKITVDSDDSYAAKAFDVFLGSDGHEYQSHGESHIVDQWVHYAGCELCKSRLDTILSRIKKLEDNDKRKRI